MKKWLLVLLILLVPCLAVAAEPPIPADPALVSVLLPEYELVEGIINELCNMPQRVVAVGSIPDEKKGEALLVLYTPETPMTPDEIVAELRERSISNLWIPKAANFHPVEKLPLLGSGKLDLSLLRTMADRIAAERK